MATPNWSELHDEDDISWLRTRAKIPNEFNIEVAGKEIPRKGDFTKLPFSTLCILEGGVEFPLHHLLVECLARWNAFPTQCSTNVFRIIMGVVALNRLLNIDLGYSEITYCYSAQRSKEGIISLRVKPQRDYLVTNLPDPQYDKAQQYVYVSGPLIDPELFHAADFPLEFYTKGIDKKKSKAEFPPQIDLIHQAWSYPDRAAHQLLGYTPVNTHFGSKSRGIPTEASKLEVKNAGLPEPSQKRALTPEYLEDSSDCEPLIRRSKRTRICLEDVTILKSNPLEKIPRHEGHSGAENAKSFDNNLSLIPYTNSALSEDAPQTSSVLDTWRPTLSRAGRPITVEDSISDHRTAEGLLKVFLLPRDHLIIQSKPVSSIFPKFCHHLSSIATVTNELSRRTHQTLCLLEEEKEQNSLLSHLADDAENEISQLKHKLNEVEMAYHEERQSSLAKDCKLKEALSLIDRLDSSNGELTRKNLELLNQMESENEHAYNEAMDQAVDELPQIQEDAWMEGFKNGWKKREQLNNGKATECSEEEWKVRAADVSRFYGIPF